MHLECRIGGEKMKWHEINIVTTKNASDVISQMLMDLGANGVAIEENICDGQEEDIVKAYIDEGKNLEVLNLEVKSRLLKIESHIPIGKALVNIRSVDDEDWANNWKKYYKPFNITDTIVIKPTWEIYEEKTNEKIILLDPGMAFGTGTHETTRLCVEFIEKYMKKNYNVADIGCGSGILSIAASLLGASEVKAVDVDHIAVRVTKENVKLNNLSNISAKTGSLKSLGSVKFDLIAANIIADVLIDISDGVGEYLKDNGLLILSGIILSRKNEVLECYKKLGFSLVDEKNMGEWVAYTLKWQGFMQNLKI